jgi:hypothetical protein
MPNRPLKWIYQESNSFGEILNTKKKTIKKKPHFRNDNIKKYSMNTSKIKEFNINYLLHIVATKMVLK